MKEYRFDFVMRGDDPFGADPKYIYVCHLVLVRSFRDIDPRSTKIHTGILTKRADTGSRPTPNSVKVRIPKGFNEGGMPDGDIYIEVPGGKMEKEYIIEKSRRHFISPYPGNYWLQILLPA